MYLFLTKYSRYIIIFLTTFMISMKAGANPNEAASFINDLAQRVITIVKQTSTSEKEVEAQLDAIFLQSVDTKWIGRFSMGKYWRTISPSQQEQFLNLYSEYLTGLYVPNFRKYTGNEVKVLNAVETRPKEFLVQTELTDPLKSVNIKINYRLLQKDSGIENFVIFDVVAEGVSLITAQRAEINSVMESGNYDALMKILRKKTAEVTK